VIGQADFYFLVSMVDFSMAESALAAKPTGAVGIAAPSGVVLLLCFKASQIGLVQSLVILGPVWKLE
jgi:hypothetical protein